MKQIRLTKRASRGDTARFNRVLARWARHVVDRGYTIEVGDDPARATMIWQAKKPGTVPAEGGSR